MKRLLRLAEVAEILNCSTRTIYRLIAEGQLQAVQIRQAWRVDPVDLDRFIDQGKQQYSENYGFLANSATG